MFDRIIYTIWEKLSQIGLILAAIALFKSRKKLNYYYLIYIVFYIGLMLIMKVVYDRYSLQLIPVFLILFITAFDNFRLDKLKTLIVSIGLLLTILYSYNFGMDFVVLNKRLWDYANNLHATQRVPRNQISAGYGWRRVYYNGTNVYKYLFNFQLAQEDKKLNCCYFPIDKLTIKYPLNIFENPYVYFYKQNTKAKL